MRLLAKEGVKVRKLSGEDIKKFCGRGLPLRTTLVSIGKDNSKRLIDDQASKVGAPETFESDIFGTIAEILVQMFRRSTGLEISNLSNIPFWVRG